MSKAYQQSGIGVAGDYSERIDPLFAEWNIDGSPGAIVAVISKGKIVHQRGYGVANVEDDVPFSSDTVLRLGSTSKHFCATCILILQERGKLDLGDDIRQYVPELPAYEATITLHHLLTMTSGLWDGINALLFCGLDTSTIVTRQEMLGLIQCQQTLMYQPGDDCQYSNSNYALLSLVVERVSGKTLGDFMQDEIFGPLGMCDSALVPFDTCITRNKARGYVPAADGALSAGMMHTELSGDGGIDSTIADMTRWFLSYRDDQNFGPDYRLRLEAESRLNDGRLIDYRLGINVTNYRGLQKVHHAGGMPGYLCDFVFYPDSDLGIILFTNMFDPKMLDLPDRVADIVLENDLARPLQSTFVSKQDASAKWLRGVFASEASGQIAEFLVEDGRLTCYLLGNATPLMKIGEGRFAPADESIVIELPNSEDVSNSDQRPIVQLVSGCQPPVSLNPVSDPRTRSTPDPGHLQTFTGIYYSDELKETHEVTLRDGQLNVNIPSPARALVWRKLVPVLGDLYGAIIDGEASCTNVAAVFLRDGEGVCTGLRYNINRCHDVCFRKLS